MSKFNSSSSSLFALPSEKPISASCSSMASSLTELSASMLAAPADPADAPSCCSRPTAGSRARSSCPLPDDRVNGITKLLKQIHSIPENKNVRVKNLRNSLMETRKKNRIEDKGVVLNKMLERGFEVINTFKCDNSDIEVVDIKFTGIMDEINDYLKDIQEGQPSVCNPIKRDMWIMLVNEKNDEVVLRNGANRT